MFNVRLARGNLQVEKAVHLSAADDVFDGVVFDAAPFPSMRCLV